MKSMRNLSAMGWKVETLSPYGYCRVNGHYSMVILNWQSVVELEGWVSLGLVDIRVTKGACYTTFILISLDAV